MSLLKEEQAHLKLEKELKKKDPLRKSKKFNIMINNFDKKASQHTSNLDDVQKENTGELKEIKTQLRDTNEIQREEAKRVKQALLKYLQENQQGKAETIGHQKEVKELRETIRQLDRETELNEAFLEESREEIGRRDKIIRGLRKKLKSKQ